MTELIINKDIKIPEGTEFRKYGKYGQFMPIDVTHEYVIVHEGFCIAVKQPREKVWLFPGDTLIDNTNGTAILMVCRLKK